MTKENKSLKVKTSSRRKFFKTAAKTGALAAAAVAMPYVKANAATTLKMQAAWPSGANIFFEMAGDYCNCLLYTSPSPRDPKTSRMPSSA